MKYLLALICLALPAYLIRFSVFDIPTTLLEVLIYAIFIIGLIRIKKASKIPGQWYLLTAIVLIAAIISVVVAPDTRMALGELKAFFIDPLMIWWLAASYLKKDDLFWLIGGLASSSLVVSAHAVIQKIIGNVTIDNRVIGIFGYSPNYLALFIAPIAMILIAWATSQKIKKKLTFIGYWLLVAINIVALYFSGSRGGLLALVGGIVVYSIMRYWKTISTKIWLKIGLGALIVLSIVTAAWLFRPDFTLRGDVPSRVISSNNVRFQIWEASIELGSKHPILGVGLGDFQNAFTDLTIKRINFDNYIIPWALTPHNLMLAFWLNTGLLGFLGFLGVFIYTIWQGLKSLSTETAIFLSGFSVIILEGLIDTPYFKNDLSVLLWLLIAGVIISTKNEKNL